MLKTAVIAQFEIQSGLQNIYYFKYQNIYLLVKQYGSTHLI